jgi:putative intracellular protease/amidase
MSKVVIILTNHNQIGNTGIQTGWYLPEVAHPYHVFVENGFTVDFASPLGGATPIDEGSVKSFKEEKICQEFLANTKAQEQTQNSLKVSDLSAKDYVALFFAGGHGPMYDIPQHEETQKLAAAIYENSGVVGAVCHGPCGLVNIKLSNGELLVKGKEVCGFTNEEEEMMKLTKDMPFSLEDKLVEGGAIFKGASAWSENVVVSERLVTGQNPASATLSAQKVVDLIKK